MLDRRGLAEFYSNLRHNHYCPDCKGTSWFEPVCEGSDKLTCRGDPRAKRPGCGHEIKESEVKKFAGDCMKCRQVRRATFCAASEKYLCLYCWSEVENATQL